MFRRLLIANRGEIACRIARTCRRMGIEVVGVHSEADWDALHVREIGDSILLGPAPAALSYLDISKVVDAARRAGADAVHPGYGFLAENPAFAEALAEAGIAFVGPGVEVLARFGDKAAARLAGVPVVPSTETPTADVADALSALATMELPVLLKASAGGGGKGMRVVTDMTDALPSLQAAMREARNSFGDPRLILERFIPDARHVEVQILGDGEGGVIHLFDRECSLQRRHQKVVEEAPCVSLDAGLRASLLDHAVRLGQSVSYLGLGTVEFIARGGEAWFLEVNPRIQVEHPVTEEVTGLDLVELQLISVAERRLPISQADVHIRGVAVEARLYADDTGRGFLPSTGRIEALRLPSGVRVDSGVRAGSEVTQHYDPMVAKLIAHGSDRTAAWDRLNAALADTAVLGVATNLGFLRHLAADTSVRRNAIDTETVDRMIKSGSGMPGPPTPADAAIAAALWLRTIRGTERVSPWTGWSPLTGWRLGTGSPAMAEAPQAVLSDRAIAFQVAFGPLDEAGRLNVSVDGAHHIIGFGEIDAAGSTALTMDDRVRLVRSHVGERAAGYTWQGRSVAFRVERYLSDGLAGAGKSDGRVRAPMVGLIIAVMVAPGQFVAAGDQLAVMESMKMEIRIVASVGGEGVRGGMLPQHDGRARPGSFRRHAGRDRCAVSDRPKRIEIHEEGPREGFQHERQIFPLDQRVALVDALSMTGLHQTQVASFVNPKAVPQMADAAALFGAVRKVPRVRHTALWLNERGFAAARGTAGVDLGGIILLYASGAFSLANNGCGADAMRRRQERWLEMYEEAGVVVEAAYVMTAFGCNLEGDVPLAAVMDNVGWLADRFEGRKLPSIFLADTVGWAVPTEVERRVVAVRQRLPGARVGLHLHDTRGAAMACFLAALQNGVDLFDASVAGLGGCPFAGSAHGAAAGNICTEDMVFMAHEMGIETGVDLDALIEAARLAERIIGRPLPGKIMHTGPLAKYRRASGMCA